MKKIMLLFLISLLSACASVNRGIAHFEDSRDNAYLHSKMGPGLQIPAGLNGSKIHEHYPIPTLPNSAPVIKSPSIAPPGVSAKADGHNEQQTPMLAQDDAHNPVLYIPGAMGNNWPRLGQALQSAGFRTVKAQADIESYFILATAKQQTKASIYQVHVATSGGFTAVNILDLSNKPAAKAFSQKVLAAIQQKLVKG